MKENRLVATEKRVFVSRDQSNLIAQFAFFGQTQFQFHNSRNTKPTSKANSFPKVLIFLIESLMEKNDVVVTEKFEIENGVESKMLANLDQG